MPRAVALEMGRLVASVLLKMTLQEQSYLEHSVVVVVIRVREVVVAAVREAAAVQGMLG